MALDPRFPDLEAGHGVGFSGYSDEDSLPGVSTTLVVIGSAILGVVAAVGLIALWVLH